MDIRKLIEPKINPKIPQILPGDTVKVGFIISEGDKERSQYFEGMVIRVRKGVDGGSFTVRKISYGVGVECTFPFQSATIQGVDVLRHGKVRRARLFYTRRLTAKRSRLKERREKVVEEVAHETD